MGIIAAQDHWLTGSRLLFQRDPVASVPQPHRDLGVIEPANPGLEIEKIELNDSDGGVISIVTESVVKIDETYEITCSNLGPKNLSLLFLANDPESFVQSASAVTDVKHYAHPGELVKLLDGDYDAATPGGPIFGIASIQEVTGVGGSPTYVEDTDWETVDLERGVIRMISGGAFAAAAAILVDYTPRAITGDRMIVPQGLLGTVEGNAILIYGRGNNAQQSARYGRVSLTPVSANFQIEDYSNFVLSLKFLSDLTAATPAGNLLYWVGALPAVS